MASPLRRVQTPPNQAQEIQGVNFGDMSMYVAGGGLQDGPYCLFFNVVNFQAKRANGTVAGASRLGVMLDAYSLLDPKPDSMKQQFLSMGTNADKSFAPHPITGKGIVPIAGAPSVNMPNSTNWAAFLQSLYDCGMPMGTFTNDISTLDGIWVHVQNIPEPEERKGFRNNQAATGEAAMSGADAPQGKGTIPVVTEILDGGKPWEGTGGVPDKPVAFAAPAPAAANAPRSIARPAAQPATPGPIAPPAPPASIAPPARGIQPPARQAAAPPAAPAPSTFDELDIQMMAQNGLYSVLEKNPKGCTKLILRTGTFAAVKAASKNDDMASAVIDTYFAGSPQSEDNLTLLVDSLGYSYANDVIRPKA